MVMVNIRKLSHSVLSFTVIFFSGQVYSLDWRLTTNLNVEETFSDNILQTNQNEKTAFVTDVSPGLSLSGVSPWSRFDLNYRLQSLYNAGGSSGIDLNNQLQMNTHYEFVRNRLYVDSSSSISQQNTSNRRIRTDNLSGSSNSTDVQTFRLSPYWTPHFNEYANGEFRVTYDRVDTSGGDSQLSQTDSLSQNIRLNSGRFFKRVGWRLEFNNSTRNNSDSENVDFQDALLELRYTFLRDWNTFFRTGYSNNSFSSTTDSNNNGVFYTFGGQWKPSNRFRVQAGIGNNRFVTVEVMPFNRLRWITTYSNNDIGLNTGDVWNTSISYNTRRSVWTASYSEQTMTTQQLLLDEQIFTVNDAFGDRNTNILETQDPYYNSSLPSLTDEVFINKNANISGSIRTGKSVFSSELYWITRSYEISQNDEEVVGISGSWSWDMIKKTRLNVRANYQETSSNGENSFSDTRYEFSVGLTRNILSRLNTRVEYRFVDQSSDDQLNDYVENRISASLNYRF